MTKQYKEAEKDLELKKRIIGLREKGVSEAYIKSYVLGWVKKPSKN